MGIAITEEKLRHAIDERREEAAELLKHPDKLESYLIKAEEKLKNMKGNLVGLENVPLLISMVRSYVKKEYTEIPLVTMVGVVAAIIYVVLPTDLISDAIPYVGFVDDAAVVVFVMQLAAADIDIYRDWRNNHYGI